VAPEQIDNIENMENYVLHGRSEIIQKLRQLSKKNTLMSVHFDGNTMLTTIIDILPEKNLLVLDYGASEIMNKKLIQADKAVIKTDYDGIVSQFTVHKVQKARLRGSQTLACALPDKVLWVQRRESYRVKVPLSEKVICELTFSNNQVEQYPVLDISQGGLALFDSNHELDLELELELEPGKVFEHCKLILGQHSTSYIDLEIRNHIPLNPQEISEGSRCGCAFLNLNGNFEMSLQKFINMVEMQQKRVD